MTPDAPDYAPPRVLLATPHYGAVSMGLIHTINGAVRDHALLSVVRQAQASSSVLPHCFNEIFAHALDARDAGEVTHLAMAHADILAEPGWLDRLWGEMWTRSLDLISAVVPIKGPTGRTSTAVGVAGDRWRVDRCVHLKDRATLPTTFTAADACPGGVLLVNTGLMLLDLRRPYWDDFAFEFHTRITRNPDGTRSASCRSEDWEMSHHLHDHGAPYGATWRVKLRHEGNARYPNYEDG